MKTNIPLEEQVVSLEVAKELDKKLNGAGIEFEAHYFWRTFDMYNLKTDKAADCFRLLQKGEESHAMMATQLDEDGKATWHFGKNVKDYPAPTLTEMLRQLPYAVEFKRCENDCLWQKPGKHCGKIGYLEIMFDADGTRISYNCQMEHKNIITFMSEPSGVNLATAAAQLFIWLVDNGYIKL